MAVLLHISCLGSAFAVGSGRVRLASRVFLLARNSPPFSRSGPLPPQAPTPCNFRRRSRLDWVESSRYDQALLCKTSEGVRVVPKIHKTPRSVLRTRNAALELKIGFGFVRRAVGSISCPGRSGGVARPRHVYEAPSELWFGCGGGLAESGVMRLAICAWGPDGSSAPMLP